jgi:hypothetical protein
MKMCRSKSIVPIEALQTFILAYLLKCMKYVSIWAHGSRNLQNATVRETCAKINDDSRQRIEKYN